MEKRYQVFISSTFTDLREERSVVLENLLRLNCFPAGMELFPAADDEQFEYIKQVIDDSDYYIVLIGGRYGSLADDGLSYTEKEFDYAVAKRIPVLAFIHEDLDKLPAGRIDKQDSKQKKLRDFTRKAESGRLVQYWGNPDQLASKVILSMVDAIKRYPRAGWSRGGEDNDLMAQLISLQRKYDEAVEERNRLKKLTIQEAEGSDEMSLEVVYKNTLGEWEKTWADVSEIAFEYLCNYYGIDESWECDYRDSAAIANRIINEGELELAIEEYFVKNKIASPGIEVHTISLSQVIDAFAASKMIYEVDYETGDSAAAKYLFAEKTLKDFETEVFNRFKESLN